MSNEREVGEANELITVDPEEFNEILKRLHSMLITRAETARAKKEASPSEKNDSNHVEAIKDAFALTHLMQLVDAMTEEITDLRELLQFDAVEENPIVRPSKLHISKKTTFLN